MRTDIEKELDREFKEELNDKRAGKSSARLIFGVIGTVLFFLSFISYFILAYAAFEGVEEGLFGGAYVYGFDAVKSVFIWLCIIPVYPICLVYEILFFILYIRKRSAALKIATAISAAIVMTAILIPCIRFEKMKSDMLKKYTPRIESYIALYYGEDVASNIRVELENYESRSFNIYTDILPDSTPFLMWDSDHAQEFYDDFINKFLSVHPTFKDELSAYAAKSFDLPDNYSLVININAIDFTGYKDGDDVNALFEKSYYDINVVKVDLDSVSDDIVVDTSVDIWHKYAKGPFKPHLKDYFEILYTRNGNREYLVSVTLPIPENSNLPVGVARPYPETSFSTEIADSYFYLDNNRDF